MKKWSKLSASVRAALAAACGAVFVLPLLFEGALGVCGLSADANSGAPSEGGMTANGIYSVHEESVLEVESELLTFEIPSFPNMPGEGQAYDARVTAEYTFTNPTDEYVTTQMAFPYGVRPDYARRLDVAEISDPIKIDGQAAEYEVRHTYGLFGDFMVDVLNIRDGYIEDDFYSPELPVTIYTVGATYEVKSGFSASARLRLENIAGYGDNTRFIGPFRNTGGVLTAWESIRSGVGVNFYVLGDDFALDGREWKVSSYSDKAGGYVDIDAYVKITRQTTTLGELIFLRYDEECGISRVDWYNGAISGLSDDAVAGYEKDIQPDASSFNAWYVYETNVAPHSSFTNSVTAPLFPIIYYDYTPNVFEYEYYLSPAKSWADFGELEIVINSPYYIQSDFTSGNVTFKSAEGGYSATYSGLPEGELTFALCSVQTPQFLKRADSTDILPDQWGLYALLWIAALLPFAIIAVTATVLIAKRKRGKSAANGAGSSRK